MKGKTSKGFGYEIKEETLDNMELVECMAEVDENPLLFPKVCKMILGEEQKKALYDFYRTDDGRVPIDDISNAIQEIFESSDEVKNS